MNHAEPAAKQVSNWNVPNALTTLRIVMVPVLRLGAAPRRRADLTWRWVAFVLFVTAMITDKIDGDLARKHNLVTDFGKIADPIADKAITGMAFIGLAVIHDFLPAWLWWTITILVLVREWSVTFARLSIAKDVVMPAKQSGKVKTTFQAHRARRLRGTLRPLRGQPGDPGRPGVVGGRGVPRRCGRADDDLRAGVRPRRHPSPARRPRRPLRAPGSVAALPVPVGAHVLPVAAAALAEAPGPVAREVDHDVVAVLGSAGLEPVQLACRGSRPRRPSRPRPPSGWPAARPAGRRGCASRYPSWSTSWGRARASASTSLTSGTSSASSASQRRRSTGPQVAHLLQLRVAADPVAGPPVLVEEAHQVGLGAQLSPSAGPLSCSGAVLTSAAAATRATSVS